MRVVNVRQLHEKTGAIVDLVAEGNVVVVVKRGRRVAELRPADAARGDGTLPDRSALLARYPRLKGDSGRYLEEDRS
jgi:antitoxin (DNA-binding transcriptional repressor) of toxin-antitoxin stability system